MTVLGSATFSPCGRYRYTLTRELAADGRGTCTFVMLNPSTADATTNDPTVRRCVGYATDWGFASLIVVNLFALRSTDPKALYEAEDPIGPDNDRAIVDAAVSARFVVCAWGNHGALRGRSDVVIANLLATHDNVRTFGLTGRCEPVHPLYQRADAKPIYLRTAIGEFKLRTRKVTS